MSSRLKILTGIFLVGLCLWFSPVPEGLTQIGWRLLVVFVLTIISIILKPLPMGAVSLTCIAILGLTKTIPMKTCLSSYASPIIWMIVFAFFIARGFIATGLGSRLVYFFMSIFGRNTIGLSYGFAITDFILSPAIPSNTARGGGIVFPIVKSLVEVFENKDSTSRLGAKLGGFLVTAAFHSNTITSVMFVTAMAGNGLVVSFAKDAGVIISWTDWAFACILPGIICLVLSPVIIYFLVPPEMKVIPNAREMARQRLKEMGSMDFKQIVMLVTFIVILVLWVFGQQISVSPTLAALTGIVILLLTGVLSWDDLIGERSAWNTLVWFSILLMLARQLQVYEVVDWFGSNISNLTESYSENITYIMISVIYYFSHYFFASSTSMVSAVYPVFLSVLISSGVDPFRAAISLSAFSTLSACLTHYGGAVNSLYFGANYVTMSQWWVTGALLSVFYLCIWLVFGNAWWSFLGYVA
jgi:divalent anion:Na+ symporter, DASS family